ncbi:hypothetical protein FQN49_006046 [Arthroderma sp. PD_2]|nr:hypothetical protein FQN49_006046 [Arthroderma sp. PD_2]
MARLYIAKPNDVSKVKRTSVRNKNKENVKVKSANMSGAEAEAWGEERDEEFPRRDMTDQGSEDNTTETARPKKHRDGQGTLISQFTDMSLTSEKREKGKKLRRPRSASQEYSDGTSTPSLLAQSTEEDEVEIPQADSKMEKDVVRRLTQLRLQGDCQSDEEGENDLGNNIPDERETVIQKDRRKRGALIPESPGEESSDNGDQGDHRIDLSDEDDDDGFDSLDDFIVSDDESLSLYEESESERNDGKEEDEKRKSGSPGHIVSDTTHPDSDTDPEPQRRPRRRLIRGRRVPRASTPVHNPDDGPNDDDITENPLSLSANPLLSTSVGNNIICPAGEEETGQNKDIKTDLLSDSKPFFPPPTSFTTSKDHRVQDKNNLNLTPSKKAKGKAIDFSKGTSQPSPEPPQERNSQMDLVTPPTSPSKPCLKSPSKSQTNRIPASPHRPSIDMFWSQEAVNQWNDKFSPRKMQTPKFHLRNFDSFSDTDEEEDEEGQSLNNKDDDYQIADVSIPGHLGTPDPESSADTLPLYTSPIKNNASPGKKQTKASASTKKALAAKKREFDEQKHALATEFLNELDTMVTGGKILNLTKSAGGVNIVWNNKLATTAGRATWKKERITKTRESTEQQLIGSSSANLCSPNMSSSHPSSSMVSPTTSSLTKTKSSPSLKRSTSSRSIRHNATIELAEKVIDSEDRLLNTLAHEYCHLANFMISGVLNQPHGASFKQWAKECKAALDSNPKYSGRVEVNTKHSYLINYKYMWCCGTCGQEYGRHSRSIDPAKVRCGKCYDGMLLQVKPKPRGKAKTKEV